jgi:hypothetical protein
MFTFLIQHQFWAAVVLYWVFSAAVSALPEPAENAASGYLWLFRFLHSVAGNLTTVFGNKIPGIKTLALVLMIPLLLSTTACTANRYVIHPGALNPADSASYDTLLVAETAIDSARADYQAGRLPDSTRAAFNTLVRSYSVARASWLTYRSAIATNVPSDDYFNQLNKNLLDLSNALRGFEEAQ